MKKNKTMRIASVVMMAALLSTCAISGTFAKYTSASTGKDTARVAKWDIQLEGAQMTSENETFKFDLFEDTAYSNVAAGGLIAPGTEGSFEINIQNASEVVAQYSIEFTAPETDGDIPIIYSTDNSTDISTWKSDITQLNIAASDDTKLAIGATAEPVTIYWKWVFDGADAADTALGEAGKATVTVTAKVTAEQVD